MLRVKGILYQSAANSKKWEAVIFRIQVAELEDTLDMVVPFKPCNAL